MQQRLPGTGSRARRGRQETALNDTFRAWTEVGHLAGPEFYALRQTLRVQAQAVDALTVDGRAAAAAQAAATLHAQLRELQAPSTSDAFDEFLDSLATS